MQRIGVLALCAIVSASALLPAAAQDAGTQASPPVAKAAPAAKPASKPRQRKPAVARQAAPPAADSYQLVPSRSGSALERARQNSFGTPDEAPSSSRGSRRVGIGLGGAGGTSPGMAIGF